VPGNAERFQHQRTPTRADVGLWPTTAPTTTSSVDIGPLWLADDHYVVESGSAICFASEELCPTSTIDISPDELGRWALSRGLPGQVVFQFTAPPQGSPWIEGIDAGVVKYSPTNQRGRLAAASYRLIAVRAQRLTSTGAQLATGLRVVLDRALSRPGFRLLPSFGCSRKALFSRSEIATSIGIVHNLAT